MPTYAALGLVQVWHILFSPHSGEEVMLADYFILASSAAYRMHGEAPLSHNTQKG